MAKAFAWNAKDAGLSLAQHYCFPCQITSREKIIYKLFKIFPVHENLKSTVQLINTIKMPTMYVPYTSMAIYSSR